MATNRGASASNRAARRAASTARRAAAGDEAADEPVMKHAAAGDSEEGDPVVPDTNDRPTSRQKLVDQGVLGRTGDTEHPSAEGDASVEGDADSDRWVGDAGESDQPRPIQRKLTVAPVRKAKPTPKRDQSGRAEHHATTPAQFVRQSVGELRKVVWPSGDTVLQYWIVVLVFVAFIMAFVSLLDYGLGQLLLKLIG